ncbi:MAG: mechanosensitive ion channel domain-containing protein [Actinomycetota bacterium]
MKLAAASPGQACTDEHGWICEKLFALTDNETIASVSDQILGPALRIAGVVLIAFLMRKLLKRVIERIIKAAIVKGLEANASASPAAMQRSSVRGQTVAGVLKALGSATIWVLASLIVLGELGINLAPLIAGLGIVGIALGFGAQNLVSDLVSGLFMLVEDQFGVGDIIEVDGLWGEVEHVGLRTTQVRGLDGMLYTLRNGNIKLTGNANKGWTRVLLDINVAYATDLRRAASVIKQVAEEASREAELAGMFKGEPEIWGVTDFGDNSISIRLVVKSAPAAHWQLGRDLRLRIKEAFDREGIEIPLPQRTTWIRTEPGTLPAPIPLTVADGVSGNGSGGPSAKPRSQPETKPQKHGRSEKVPAPDEDSWSTMYAGPDPDPSVDQPPGSEGAEPPNP